MGKKYCVSRDEFGPGEQVILQIVNNCPDPNCVHKQRQVRRKPRKRARTDSLGLSSTVGTDSSMNAEQFVSTDPSDGHQHRSPVFGCDQVSESGKKAS